MSFCRKFMSRAELYRNSVEADRDVEYIHDALKPRRMQKLVDELQRIWPAPVTAFFVVQEKKK